MRAETEIALKLKDYLAGDRGPGVERAPKKTHAAFAAEIEVAKCTIDRIVQETQGCSRRLERKITEATNGLVGHVDLDYEVRRPADRDAA